MELLRDPAVDRADFVVRGIDALDRVRNNPEVIDAILDRIENAPSAWDNSLVEMVIRRASDHAGVRKLVLSELERHGCPYSAIAEGFAHDVEIRERVARVLRPLSDDLRLLMAEELLHSSPFDTDISAICDGYRGDQTAEVATAAAIFMVRQREGTDHVRFLLEELSCYGPEHEIRRQAAYAAALEVGQQELIEKQTETSGAATKLRVGLASSREPNRVLVEQVLTRWDVLQALYPDAVLARLCGDMDSALKASDRELGDWEWSQLADVVDGFPIPRERLDSYLESRPAGPLASSLLRYLARRDPRSQRLKTHCVLALGSDQREHLFRPLERVKVATEILVSQFRDDDRLWNEIASQLGAANPLRVPPGPFVALARVRPEHPSVAEIAKRVLKQPTGESAYVVFYALCAVGPPLQLLDRAAHYWGPRGRRFGGWLYQPLVERMRRDETVMAEVRQGALSNQSIPIRASLSIATATAGGLTRELTSSLRATLREEVTASRPSSFAFDPRSGHVGPTAALVVDILSEEGLGG